MKKITDKEYEEWQKYRLAQLNGRILTPDAVRFICEAYNFDPAKIGQHFLDTLPGQKKG